MDNQQPLNNSFSQSINAAPAPAEPPKLKKSKKKLILLSVLLGLPVLLGSTAAYGYYVYIPQKPEYILKKAVENLTKKVDSYSLTGRLDQSDPNLPDFDYTINLDNKGNASATINEQSTVVSPVYDAVVKDGKTYFKVTNLDDRASLAKKYTNLGPKGLQEYTAEFAEFSGLATHQDKWLEVPSYLFERVNTSGGSNGSSSSLEAKLTSIDAKEEKEGKKLQRYTISITIEEFMSQISSLVGAGNIGSIDSLLANFDGGFNASDSIDLTVWADVKTKVFERIEYSGRPFANSTFSVTVERKDVTVEAPTALPLTSVLNYGIAWSELIRADMQNGKTDRDKERIADLKGMKLALEIFKAKNGVYPDRYNIAVQQEQYLNKDMPHVDHQLFIDPAGRRAGLNGSQYAYVPETADGSSSCGPLNGAPCEKFFIVTTLDDGTEYQLNSGL